MENLSLATDPGRRPIANYLLHGATIVFAVAAIAVTIYFGLRSEKEKSLAITFSPLRQLVDVDATSVNDLEVRYANQRLSEPTLLSVKLENIGNLSIESDDIDEPLELRFSQGGVLTARVTNTTPDGIATEIEVSDHSVTLVHRLLNKGDSIEFDVLFDGKAELPTPHIRVSGVNQLEIIRASDTNRRPTVSVVDLPREVVLVLLLVMSGTVFSIAGIGVVAFGSILKAVVFGEPNYIHRAWVHTKPQVFGFLDELVPESEELDEELYEYLGSDLDQLTLENIVDAPSLESLFDNAMANSENNYLAEGIAEVRQRFVEQLPRAMQHAVVELFNTMVPEEAWKGIAKSVANLDFSSIPSSEWKNQIEVVAALYEQTQQKLTGVQAIDRDDIYYSTVFILSGISGIIILGGSWRTFLGM